MEQQTVHLFVLDTLADWEPALAVGAINSQTYPGRLSHSRVRTVGASKEPVVTMGGVTILPDMTLDDLDPAESAMLILPGGDTWDAGENGEAAEKARQFLAAGVPVAAICGATAGLARAGLLDDVQHTSNARGYLQATGYGGGAHYKEEPAVTDGNLITAGATAPVDFAYHILKRLGVYDIRVLDAWYGLFKTGDPSYFFALQEAATALSA